MSARDIGLRKPRKREDNFCGRVRAASPALKKIFALSRFAQTNILTLTVALSVTTMGCRDVTRYSSRGDHFEGEVVKGSFVRAGVGEDAKMCLVLDAEHLQSAPGTISTSDGRFRSTTLRPIPQIWHDPLSTLAFGDGRRENLVYVATPLAPAGDTQDIMVVMSLMNGGGVEIRLVRGAPQADAGASGSPPPTSPPLFGVFTLDRHEGACTF